MTQTITTTINRFEVNHSKQFKIVDNIRNCELIVHGDGEDAAYYRKALDKGALMENGVDNSPMELFTTSELLSPMTDMQLLAELISRNGLHDGPTESKYPNGIKECTVDIGNDNLVDIRLSSDDYAALRMLTQ